MIRNMIDSSDDKTFSQGTLFNCAYSINYTNEEILGLVITARCDIANKGKVSFYNFIPAVPFSKWKEKELIDLLKKRVFNDQLAKYLQLIKQAKFTESNLETYGYDKVLYIIKKEKRLKTDEIKRLEESRHKINLLQNLTPFVELRKHFHKDIKKIIDSIIENKESDYFFIDNILGYGATIVNLREIYMLKKELGDAIPNGLELTATPNKSGININTGNGLCSVVGQLKSPYTELLLQRFSTNFMRIGVDNPNSSLCDSLLENNA